MAWAWQGVTVPPAVRAPRTWVIGPDQMVQDPTEAVTSAPVVGLEPVTVPSPSGSKVTGTPAMALPKRSVTCTRGITLTARLTTVSWNPALTGKMRAALPALTAAVTAVGGTPVVAKVRVWVPILLPRVQVVSAFPSASVVRLAGEAEPPAPDSIATVTTTSGRGPWASLARTMIFPGSASPTEPT